jgi:cystathionine beta-lyase
VQGNLAAMSDNNVVAPALSELLTHSSEKWRGFPADVLPLPVMEMDFPVAEAIRDVLIKMVTNSDLGYLGPVPELADQFAAFCKKRWNWEIDTAQVRIAADVGVGCVEVLRVFTKPGDRILINSPVYQNFYNWMNETKLEKVDIPFVNSGSLSGDVNPWTLDLDEVEKVYASGIKVHLLCSPHNPLGRIYSHAELTRIAEMAKKYGVIVISDEIHSPLVFKGHEFFPFLNISETAREVGVVVTSASKGWNIAGLKSALIVSQNQAIDEVLKLMPPAVKFRSSILGAFASAAAFKDGEVWLDSVIKILEENSLMVRDLLSAKLPSVKTHLPQSSYVAWLDLTSLNLGENPAQTLLERGKVAFNAGHMYGPESAQFVRLNFATSPTILTEAIDRIVKSL